MKKETDKNIPERLIKLREVMGLSQRGLAEKFGVAHGAIGLWENGKRAVSGPALKLLELYEESVYLKKNKLKSEEKQASQKIETSFLGRNLKLSKDLVFSFSDITFQQIKEVIQNRSGENSILENAKISIARRLVKSMGELKGITLKLGQLISYIDVTLFDSIQEIFETLQSQTVPMSHDQVLHLFLKDFQKTPLQLFAEWEQTPIAAASIGQVHHAKLKNGEKIAVKIQYPEIKKAIETDLKSLKIFCHLSSLLSGWTDPKPFFEELQIKFMEECDYLKEAENIEIFRSFFSSHPNIKIPKIFKNYSSRQILTMEKMDGKPFKEFLSDASQKEKNEAGKTIFDFTYQSIFKRQILNGDPHPGNYLFQKSGVCFLDFGCVKNYSEDFVLKWKNLLRVISDGNGIKIDEAFLETGFLIDRKGFDFEYNRQMLKILSEPWLAKQPFSFCPEYVHKTWKVSVTHNPNRFLIKVPKDYLFFERVQWGVYSVLSKLGATYNWKKMIEKYF